MKKYSYLIAGIIVTVLLVSLAILSYFDRTVLTPARNDPIQDVSGHVPAVKSKARTQPFFSEEDDAHPTAATASHSAPGSLAPPDLGLRLIGTTVFGDKSTAILEDTVRKSRGIYRLKDMVRGYTLSAIDADSVTLTAGGFSYVLTRSAGYGEQTADAGFIRIDENSWLVSARKAAAMVSNIEGYAGQVIAFQHREHGEAAGFKIRHLQQGNDFEKLGIKNNDIIKRVNGLAVNDLKDVLKAVYQLSDATEFTLEVDRDGVTQALHYQLDEQLNTGQLLIKRIGDVLAGNDRP